MKYWIEAIRPKTLPAAIAPVMLGSALGIKELNFSNSLAIDLRVIAIITITAITALLLQITTNLINDYYDCKSGIDGEDRLGPKRVTQSGLISAENVKRGFLFTILLSLCLGVILVMRGGVPILIVGILSIIFAWSYTAGPIPLSHIGLGELLALIFFGPVAICGTYFLITLKFDPFIIFVGLGVGAISSAIMAINNIRDFESDSKRGKKTLAVLLGERGGRILPIFFVIISIIIFINYFINYFMFKNNIFILCLLILVFWPSFFRVWRGILIDPLDRKFNYYLAQTGKYLLYYSILFSIGIIII
ncbi:MAG: 1,4-dihydroxy-2-naphthoate octaprenyltransferase [Oligoflexia bacterium]|nr:1,4-dihydroxy-2-naphthoate octaprenyltransferase [Oligoflexia bacterium]